MSTKRIKIPHRDDLIDYGHAVAGHAGVMCDESGQLFIKPCTQQEIDFYTSAKTERDPKTGRLKHEAFADVMPNFIGTLTLNDPAEVSSIDEAATPTAEVPETSKEISWAPSKNRRLVTDKSIVLDNASFGYKRPNILDVKLGVCLYADHAPKAKKERFDKISKETTHKNLGFRISGMRVYKGSDDDAELAEDDYKVYDKDYGRLQVNDDNVKDAFRGFVFNERAGIDVDHAKAVCAAFVEDLKRIRDALESDESRMFSASCLFTFEGDGETLKRNIREQNEQVEAAEAAEANLARRRSKGGADIPSSTRVDSGIGLEEDDDDYESTNSEDDIDSDIGDMPAKIFSVQLIDFAHAKWVPGQGPDENSLLGVRSLIKIFEELSN